MIITLVIIVFAVLLFAVIYFPYRQSINRWFRNKGYKENRNLVAAAVVAAIVVAIIVVFNFTQPSGSSDDLQAEAGSPVKNFSLDVGSALPTIALPDTAGNQVNLDEYKDQTMILAFWNTWCKYCAKQLPELKKLEQESSGKAQIFLVNMNEDAATVKKYQADQKIDFTLLVDETGSVSNLFKIQGTPTNFFVHEGIICSKVPGAMDKEMILAALEECALVSAPATTAN